MNEFNTTAIDRLRRYGVLDTEPQIPGNQTEVITQNTIPQHAQTETKDQFIHTETQPPNKIKTYCAIGLLTYLLGVACSKGKLNPIEGAKGIFNMIKSVLSSFCNIFKKS